MNTRTCASIFPLGNFVAMTPCQFGEIVRGARRSLGLRQDQLACAAGVGVRFIVELEAGKATAQLGKTLAVLNALGCEVRVDTPAM